MHGRSSSLREAHVHGIGHAGEFLGRIAGCDACIEESRTIDVDVDVVLAGHLGHRLESGEGPHASTAAIVAVLDRDHPGSRVVDVSMPNRGCDRFGVEEPARPVDSMNHAAGEGGRPSRLVVDDVVVVMRDDLVATLADGSDRQLIGHGSRGCEEGRFLAEDPRNLPFKGDDRGLVAENVVAKGCGTHRVPHRLGGLGDGVAPQIDFVGAHESSVSVCGAGVTGFCLGTAGTSTSPTSEWEALETSD